jgi:3-deoxy-D-manno-octulosonic-acid transferase
MIDCVSYATYDLVGNALGLVALCGVPFLLMTRHGRGLAERLGRRPLALRSLRHPVWIHAASVGEVLAAQPLIQQLRVRRPDLPILISTTSVTGRETARAHLGAEAVMLSPLDLGWIVAHLLRRVQPCCLIIVETELWPALIRAASRRHTPVLVVSGRLSERSAVHYGWIRPLTRAVLRRVSAFAMQTEADASRILALGAPPARVQVVGSLKFARETTRGDAVDDTLAAEVRALLAGRRILIAASTHAGEERMVLEACAGLWAQYPQVLLLIAPRRPERFGEMDQLLAQAGVRWQRRSQLRGPVDRSTQVLLLDTIGELPHVLVEACAVFVGGTIAPVGGHNVLEPALFGKPVAFGPHTGNVTAAAEALLRGQAATRVADARALGAEWRRLLAAPAAAAEMGARARAIVAAHAAVAERTADIVCRHLDAHAPQATARGTNGHARFDSPMPASS